MDHFCTVDLYKYDGCKIIKLRSANGSTINMSKAKKATMRILGSYI